MLSSSGTGHHEILNPKFCKTASLTLCLHGQLCIKRQGCVPEILADGALSVTVWHTGAILKVKLTYSMHSMLYKNSICRGTFLVQLYIYGLRQNGVGHILIQDCGQSSINLQIFLCLPFHLLIFSNPVYDHFWSVHLHRRLKTMLIDIFTSRLNSDNNRVQIYTFSQSQ